MTVKAAIKPDFFVNVPSLAKTGGNEALTEEELALHAMSQTAGWKIFKDIAISVT